MVQSAHQPDDLASGETLAQIGQTTLEMQFASREQDVLATREVLVLGTRITLYQELQAPNQLGPGRPG